MYINILINIYTCICTNTYKDGGEAGGSEGEKSKVFSVYQVFDTYIVVAGV
jgi:hypothetical protein